MAIQELIIERPYEPLNPKTAPTPRHENYDREKPHANFLESLKDVDREVFMSGVSGFEQRKYQINASNAIVDGMLNGHTRGRLIIGTAGGKTTIALNVVSQTKGKVLWIAPSKIAAERVEQEIEMIKALHSNWDKVHQRVGGVAGKKFDHFNPDMDITIMTAQTLLYDERFKGLNPHQFDLVVFDEAHRFMGPKMKQITAHFNGYQIHMTATEANTVHSLDEFVSHEFHRYSSDALVANDDFPDWLYHRYKIYGEHPERAEVCGDQIVIEEGRENEVLNMTAREATCLEILRKCVRDDEQVIFFFPTVNTSKRFIEGIVYNDPELKAYKDRFVHVDGTTQNIREIERKFRSGDILGACCNSVWDESLDVKNIEHVVLADLCLSARVFFQRIGRGARKGDAFSDKKHVHVHDVVSAAGKVYDCRSTGGSKALTVATLLGIENYVPGLVLNGPFAGQYFDEETQTYRAVTAAEAERIHFTERNLDLAFMQDPKYAVSLIKHFAELFDTHLYNLTENPEAFFGRKEKVLLHKPDGSFHSEITFRDAYDAAEFFLSLSFIKEAARQSIESLAAQIRGEVQTVLEDKTEEQEIKKPKKLKEKERFGKPLMLEDVFNPFRVDEFVIPENRQFRGVDFRKVIKEMFEKINAEKNDEDAINFSYEELSRMLTFGATSKYIDFLIKILTLNHINISIYLKGIQISKFGTKAEWSRLGDMKSFELHYSCLRRFGSAKNHTFSARSCSKPDLYSEHHIAGVIGNYNSLTKTTGEKIWQAIRDGQDSVMLDASTPIEDLLTLKQPKCFIRIRQIENGSIVVPLHSFIIEDRSDLVPFDPKKYDLEAQAEAMVRNRTRTYQMRNILELKKLLEMGLKNGSLCHREEMPWIMTMAINVTQRSTPPKFSTDTINYSGETINSIYIGIRKLVKNLDRCGCFMELRWDGKNHCFRLEVDFSTNSRSQQKTVKKFRTIDDIEKLSIQSIISRNIEGTYFQSGKETGFRRKNMEGFWHLVREKFCVRLAGAYSTLTWKEIAYVLNFDDKPIEIKLIQRACDELKKAVENKFGRQFEFKIDEKSKKVTFSFFEKDTGPVAVSCEDVGLEFNGTQLQWIESRAAAAVQKPKGTKLQYIDSQYCIDLNKQLFPVREMPNQDFLKLVFEAAKNGEGIKVQTNTEQETNNFVRNIFLARDYFRAFGYTGDILNLYSFQQVTIEEPDGFWTKHKPVPGTYKFCLDMDGFID